MEERRRHDRHRCKFPCEVFQGKKRVEGIVRDVSLAGLSVQVELEAEQGDDLRVLLSPPGAAIDVSVLVWNARRLRMKDGSTSWRLGMMLSDPCDPFAALVGRMAPSPSPVKKPELPSRPGRKAPPHATAAALRPATTRWFRARVKQVRGPRTRIISVPAACEKDARELAAREVGPEWEILDLKSA